MQNTPEFQALQKEYLVGAMDRVAHLREESRRLRNGEPVDLTTLRQEVHKLRGSGGFYGFSALSQAAGVAEDRLIQTLNGEAEHDPMEMATLIDQVVAATAEAARKTGL